MLEPFEVTKKLLEGLYGSFLDNESKYVSIAMFIAKLHALYNVE